MNTPPVVTVADKVALLGTSIIGTSLASATDADGDPITKFRFRDKNGANGSGKLRLGGTDQAANIWVEVTAANLGTLQFISGNRVIQDRIEVQAFDGSVWSSIAAFQVFSATPNDDAPVINASTISVVAYEKVRVSDFITAADPDGWPIDRMKFRDERVGMNSGYFEFKGQKMAENQWFFVLDMKEYDQLYWVGALNDQSERIFSRARDGAPAVGGEWNNPVISFANTTFNSTRPFVAPNSIILPQNTQIPMGNLISVSDADNNTVKKYRFLDTSFPTNSAYISTGGVRRPSNQWITVDAADLDSVSITTAAISRTDQIRVQAFDGRYWSPIQTIRVTADVQPTFSTSPVTAIEDIERIFINDLINQTDNGAVFKSFEVYDNSSTHPNPDIDLNAVLVKNTNDYLAPFEVHQMSANDFETLIIEGGKWDNRSLDEFYVRANNGRFNTRWERVTVRSEPEYLESHFMKNPNLQDPVNKWQNWISGVPIVLTYSFAENYGFDGRATGSADEIEFNSVDLAGRQAMREEFVRWNKLQDTIIFKEVSDSYVDPVYGPHGFIRIGGYNDPNDTACAFAFGPGPAEYPGQSDGSVGDIWLNYGLCFAPGQANWAKDGFQRLVFRHELGHVLGLKHTYTEPGNFPVLPTTLGNLHDYSIMFTPGDRNDGYYTRTFGLYGDAAIQALYGRGTENAGDTRYDIENYWEGDSLFDDVINDSGGIDTIAITDSFFSNTFDIRQGSFSSINGVGNNLAIGHGTVIENVTGGRGNDSIIGNSSENVLAGGFGDDDIRSMGGNDIMVGGARNDTYHWFIGDDDDIINEQKLAGIDRLVVHEFADLGFDDFTSDMTFRKLGRDLIINFNSDVDFISQGSVKIKDQLWGGSRIETLEVFGNRVDLQDLFSKTNAVEQRFVINFSDPQTSNGFLVSPV